MEPVITPPQVGSQKDFWSTLKPKKNHSPIKISVSSAKYLECTFFLGPGLDSGLYQVVKSWAPAEEQN